MSLTLQNRITRLEVLYIFFCAGLAPTLGYFNGMSPSVDGLQKMISWIPSIKSIIYEGQFPLWIPNFGHGINAAVWNQSLSGVYTIATFSVVLNILDLKQAFFFWIFVYSLITFLSIRWIFNHLKLERTWYLGLITLLSISYYTLIQVYFNFLGIAIFVLLVFVIYRFVLHQDIRRFAELIALIFCILPYGYLVYAAPLFFYIGILTLWNSRVNFSTNWKKPKSFTFNQILKLSPYLLVIIIYSCFLAYQLIASRSDISIVSPSRNEEGGQSLKSFLSYGGFQGFAKFSNILGFGFKEILSGKTHLDFWLLVSPISIGLIIVGLRYLNLRSVQNIEVRTWIVNSTFIFFFTLPFVPLTSVLFYVLPEINKLRHISYFSFLLVPSLYILSALVYKQITAARNQSEFQKKDRKRLREFKIAPGKDLIKPGKRLEKQQKLVFQIFAISLFCLIGIDYVAKVSDENYRSLTSYLWVALNQRNVLVKFGLVHFSSFVLILFVLNKIEKSQSGHTYRARIKDEMFRVIPICFVSLGIIAFIALQSSHLPIRELTNSKVESLYGFVRDPLPKIRIMPESSSRLKLITAKSSYGLGSSGQKIVYDSIAYLTNEDYCVSAGRTDVVSKSLATHSEIYSQPMVRSPSCDLPENKLGVFDRNGNALTASAFFEKLGFNEVKINYRVIDSNLNPTNEALFPIYIVYFDAQSNIGLWSATDESGSKLEFTEVPNKGDELIKKINDYKVVKVTQGTGTITLRTNMFVKVLQNTKSMLDLCILFYVLIILISSQKRITSNGLSK